MTSLLVSCSRDYKIAKIIPGQTNVAQTLELLDEPIRAKKSDFHQESEIFIWKDVSVQFKKARVFAVHRTPSSIESSLQYWRHRYQDLNSVSPLESFSTSEKLWQFNYEKHGLSIIYDERDDKVVKVIHYEAR